MIALQLDIFVTRYGNPENAAMRRRKYFLSGVFALPFI
jgi:hypothetical protein